MFPGTSVNAGALQETIVNDLSDNLSSSVKLFTDDTSLFCVYDTKVSWFFD